MEISPSTTALAKTVDMEWDLVETRRVPIGVKAVDITLHQLRNLFRVIDLDSFGLFECVSQRLNDTGAASDVRDVVSVARALLS